MKRPGDLVRQRRRAKARQRLYDAVRALRNGADASLTFRRGDHYVTYDAIPWTERSGLVVYIRRGYVGIGEISCKDSWTVIRYQHGRPEYGAEIVGQVVHSHTVPRSSPRGSDANAQDR